MQNATSLIYSTYPRGGKLKPKSTKITAHPIGKTKQNINSKMFSLKVKFSQTILKTKFELKIDLERFQLPQLSTVPRVMNLCLRFKYLCKICTLVAQYNLTFPNPQALLCGKKSKLAEHKNNAQ